MNAVYFPAECDTINIDKKVKERQQKVDSMSVLSDRIEEFIEKLLEDAEGGQAELRRNELAEHFGCAPSQISYVLSTRFCPIRGYVTESRRGGGGYVRIMRIDLVRSGSLLKVVQEELGEPGTPLCMRRAEQIVRGLRHAGQLDDATASLVLAAVEPRVLKHAGSEEDVLRGYMLRSLLTQCTAIGQKRTEVQI